MVVAKQPGDVPDKKRRNPQVEGEEGRPADHLHESIP